jgi:gp16 family phage-associated protein
MNELRVRAASGRALCVADFHEHGVSVVDWARHNGFNPGLVYQVLAGRRKSLRGQSFNIAKALGMK